ncbi:response regulator transcription factor [Litorilinea aerophila]|uniref:Response regulator transcription factor n=1 Tax=Litorilinea aerophila TaxID=1204385 RepID=A0A540VI25_9CHLR|nr:response regulator transcription factor [Litorilinea aerophila]MCC9075975.1 response regulator transcription factor [Litorilinea aerophila]OUC08693.1 LuxR family transcriptional regulator [Litorilinea aerophila]
MKRIRLLLVDDHQVVRLGLRALLDGEPDLEVVAEASSAAEAIQRCQQFQPDVVLMDIRLPDRTGIEACREIRRHCPGVQVLMLTSYGDDELVREAIAAGAAGYVLKQVSTDELLRAVRAVAQGDAVLDPKVTRQVLARVQQAEADAHSAAFRDLSERELQVLARVAEGKSNTEIAEELFLSPITVRNHVSTILQKLGLSNRIEAATYAVRHHIENVVDTSRSDS